jgi:tetratricopeptide (TPR) repeat protein
MRKQLDLHQTATTETLEIKIAQAYQENGDLETALSRYQTLNENSLNDYTKAQMALLIGRIYLERDQPDEGYAILQESVNNYPFAFDARNGFDHIRQ